MSRRAAARVSYHGDVGQLAVMNAWITGSIVGLERDGQQRDTRLVAENATASSGSPAWSLSRPMVTCGGQAANPDDVWSLPDDVLTKWGKRLKVVST